MVHRCFVLLAGVSFSVAVASPVRAQERLTEDEAVRRVLERSALGAITAADAEEAHALGLVDGAWPNPDLGYTREETLGNGGTGEDYVFVSQRIDLSGRLLLRRDAGDRRAEGIRISGEAERAELAARVRTEFHRALAAGEREAALAGWCRRVEAALSLVRSRAGAGDAAPYEAVRLSRELRVAAARRDGARAERLAIEAELASLVGIEGSIVLAGDLRPSAPDDLSDVSHVEDSPALRSLRELETAAELDREASARAWIPELVLGAGYKGVTTYGPMLPDTLSRVDGFTLTVGITLPLFDTGSAVVARDEARRDALRARLDLGTLTTRAAERGLVTRIVALLAVLDTFIAGGEAESADLVRIASAAYEGGEASLLELLDAHRAVTDDALMLVDLALEARFALIELHRIRGEE